VGGDRKLVVICSDNDAFNMGLRLMFDGSEVDVSKDPSEIGRPVDVLIWRLDGDVPGDVLRDISELAPTLVLAPTDQLMAALDAGCRGFLNADASLDEIVGAARTVADGGAVIPSDLLGTVLHHLVERRRQRRPHVDLSSLTDRETEVFDLAAEGLRKEEIAERLYISPATARTHLQRVYRKLGIHSQAELMSLTVKGGGGEEEDTSE
jgi:DNA-binding NarL/FixJ family response regulator